MRTLLWELLCSLAHAPGPIRGTATIVPHQEQRPPPLPPPQNGWPHLLNGGLVEVAQGGDVGNVLLLHERLHLRAVLPAYEVFHLVDTRQEQAQSCAHDDRTGDGGGRAPPCTHRYRCAKHMCGTHTCAHPAQQRACGHTGQSVRSHKAQPHTAGKEVQTARIEKEKHAVLTSSPPMSVVQTSHKKGWRGWASGHDTINEQRVSDKRIGWRKRDT